VTDAVQVYKEQRDVIINKLIAILCKEGQVHVYSALEAAPAAISMQKWNTMKAGQASTSVTVSDHIIGPGTTAILISMQHTTTSSSVPAQPTTSTAAASDLPFISTTGDADAAENRPKLTVFYTEKVAIRTNSCKLAAMFRLVDFMLRDALYNSIYQGMLNMQCVVEGLTEKDRKRRRMKLESIRAVAKEVLVDIRAARKASTLAQEVLAASGADNTAHGAAERRDQEHRGG
jgi:hypothetical protein